MDAHLSRPEGDEVGAPFKRTVGGKAYWYVNLRVGVPVRIPRPERCAIDRLIVAQRRRGPHLSKRRNDLAQAAALIEVLAEEMPAKLRQAYRAAMNAGPEGESAVGASLASMRQPRELVETASDRLEQTAASGLLPQEAGPGLQG